MKRCDISSSLHLEEKRHQNLLIVRIVYGSKVLHTHSFKIDETAHSKQVGLLESDIVNIIINMFSHVGVSSTE